MVNLADEPWSETSAAAKAAFRRRRPAGGGATNSRAAARLAGNGLRQGARRSARLRRRAANRRCHSAAVPYPLDGGPSGSTSGSAPNFVARTCGLEYPLPEPRLYSFNSPLGACPSAKGSATSSTSTWTWSCPSRRKTIREGAIAPWNTPAYAHELEELVALAGDYGLPLDVPFRELTDERAAIDRRGRAERNFGGLKGFFAWLERRKYKMHMRVFLSRWRSYRPCPACGGTRLRPEALATRIGGKNIAEISGMKIQDALRFFRELNLPEWQRQVGRIMLDQAQARLKYLVDVGLGYLTLDRTLRTLSGGEAQRVALTVGAGFEPGQHALRARRALGRAAPARHRSAGRRDPFAARSRQHGRGGGARRIDDPRRRPGDRNRSRGRRTRRRSRVSRHAARNARQSPQHHG